MKLVPKAPLAATASIVLSQPALAAPAWVDYSAEQFASAQAQGKTILVDVHADGCPTCKAQAPTLETMRNDERLAHLTFMRVNLDSDKAFLRAHRVPRQSTILVFQEGSRAALTYPECFA